MMGDLADLDPIAHLTDDDDGIEFGERRARITWASSIKPEPVVWVWKDAQGHGRIPAGTLSLAAGREGTGKSSWALWLAAQVTRGTLPGSFQGKCRRVLYVAVEDSWTYTLVPRLIAAGADLSMVGRFEVIDAITGSNLSLSLPTDLALFRQTITAHEIDLVVVDPLMSIVGSGINVNNEHEVRRALEPLVEIAEKTGALIVGIAHFSKADKKDVNSLVTHSGAFKNVPRSLFGFARDGAGRWFMSQTKNSQGRDDLPSFEYRIETAHVDLDSGLAETGKFVMMGQTDRHVNDVLREARHDDGDDSEERDALTEWLRDWINGHEGHQASAADAMKAIRAAGFNDGKAYVMRARKRAGIRSKKVGFEKGWYWTTEPEGSTEGSEGSHFRKQGTFETFVEPSQVDALPLQASKAASDMPDEQVTCAVCGGRMDADLAKAGQKTHPGCDEGAA